ncbi:MAG TPA: hypothetical protein VMT71_03585 [Syntrophorhabdales bacterium]|nr:hypothetical protein [Syntrophorhabdales bacterium]
MKMFVFVYAEYFDDGVTTTFKQAGYGSYIKIHNMTGEYKGLESRAGGPHSHGGLTSLLLAVPDEQISHLLDMVRDMKKEFPDAGLGAFTFPLEEVVV